MGHVMTKIEWKEPKKLKRACTLSVGAWAYDAVRKGKTCDSGTSHRYLLRTENALFIYFALESDKNGHNVGNAVVSENDYISPCY